jgi:hypothetical protein
MLPKVLWNSVLATPALVGAALIVSSSAMAAETQSVSEVDALLSEIQISADATQLEPVVSTEVASVEAPAQTSLITEMPSGVETPAASAEVDTEAATEQPAAPIAQVPVQQAPVQVSQAAPEAAAPVSSLDQIMQYGSEGANSQAQVTSITQLSDVQPTDWAYQALQSLVERYGCIAGYPDGTYRGQRAMTRFEFAAGMNACLDRISELIAASTADLATKEDLATLQRLQEEFAAELAALRGRVDALEARTSELEANQFSTTTKLNGETIFAVGVPFSENEFEGNDGDDDDDDDEGDLDDLDLDNLADDQAIAGYRVRLNFDTSFTGEDLLRARLQAREFDNLVAFGNNTDWQWSSDNPGEGDNDIVLDDLLYTFPLGDVAQIIIGANSIGDSDFVATTVSPFDSGGQGSLTNALGTPPQYNFIPGGTGIGAIFGFGDNFSLDVGYAAGNAGDPTPGNGLFNGDYGLIAQLSFLSDFVDAALTYSNSYSQDGFGSSAGFNLGSYVGVDDGGGDAQAEIANIYGAQINFKFGFLEIGGGAMYMPVRVLGRGDYDVWSYHGTLAFPDLGGDGNLLGFVAGVPPRIAGLGNGNALNDRLVGVSGATRQDAAFLAEAFYRFRVNDNISITPGLIYLNDPGSENDREDSFIGAIRTTFTF